MIPFAVCTCQALHHEKYGYYQQKKEKIGAGGDFITSPEISQLFGEMVGIWCLATWENMGSPASINLVELGPGNGTLMKDILNIVKNFPAFQSALQVSMVEVSPVMRELQYQALECSGSGSGSGGSTTPSGDDEGSTVCEDNNDKGEGEDKDEPHNDWADQTEPACMTGLTRGGTPIAWFNYLKHVPPGPALYVGHEILDAFPVHQFSKTTEGGRWRETMVDVDFDQESNSPYHFRFVKTPTITPALRIFFNKTYTGISGQPLSSPGGGGESSELDVGVGVDDDNNNNSNNSNNNSIDDSNNDNNIKEKADNALSTRNLEGLELSPLAFATVEEIARNVVQHQGAALLIDYGEQFPQVWTGLAVCCLQLQYLLSLCVSFH
jgi:NADH dehydrogenase [ubiquinone] 1 alpha subcomplex assembly factor 7